MSFEFIVSAVISRHVLGYTRLLTVALQAKNCDLHKAHRMAHSSSKHLMMIGMKISLFCYGNVLQK